MRGYWDHVVRFLVLIVDWSFSDPLRCSNADSKCRDCPRAERPEVSEWVRQLVGWAGDSVGVWIR